MKKTIDTHRSLIKTLLAGAKDLEATLQKQGSVTSDMRKRILTHVKLLSELEVSVSELPSYAEQKKDVAPVGRPKKAMKFVATGEFIGGRFGVPERAAIILKACQTPLQSYAEVAKLAGIAESTCRQMFSAGKGTITRLFKSRVRVTIVRSEEKE